MNDEGEGCDDLERSPKEDHPQQLLLRKIQTVQLKEESYYSLVRRGLFQKEQKGCCEATRGRYHQIFIHQHIFNEIKTSRKNVTIV